MQTLDFSRAALSGCAAAVLLYGCGRSLPPAPAALVQRTQSPMLRRGALHASKGQALLYVSSDYSYEKVYSFPQGKLVQTLDISGEPQALCTDKLGDVYIPQSYGEIVTEYAHGGTKPIVFWRLPNATPQGCAVDPASGNIAVAGANEKLAIFNPASATPPVYYSNSAIESFYYATYDAGGNLFVVVYSFASGYQLWELSEGNSTLKQVALPFNLCCPEDVQWDGQYLAIEASHSSGTATIDRLAVNDYRAKVKGQVHLTYTQTYTSQFWIEGSTLIHSDYYSDDVAFFKYPAGGGPTKTIVRAGPNVVGIAVSEAPK